MKRLFIAMTLVAIGCFGAVAQGNSGSNPLLIEWETPFGVPPFSKIHPEHYMPAIEVALQSAREEVSAIVSNPSTPTFRNTIEAYGDVGADLGRILSVFYCLVGTDMTPELQSIQRDLSPILTAHSSDISMNAELFKRIKSVYDRRHELGDLERRLTEKVYKGFERSGANLDSAGQSQLREIDKKLSMLTLTFGNNLRSDNGAFTLSLKVGKDTKGLPQSVVDAALAEGKKRGVNRAVFTLDKSSMLPFLQYSENRKLREKLYRGYLERANNNNKADNKEVLRQIANLRLERANLLGYKTHSHFTLENIMAKNPENVYALLNDVWAPAIETAQKELLEMKSLEGAPQDFKSWDWWFWAEKLREQKYDLSEEELRPYFELNTVRAGVFGVTESLFGLQFKELVDIETYNSENQVFEVLDSNGYHLGVLYMDFHPRSSKRVGAWCTSFRGQSYDAEGHRVSPIVSVVCNFTPPAAPGEPALLTLDEVETYFHEFGHAIHSLVSKSRYKGLRGVERDFVELPSQIMEHWAFHPEILRTYAKHYQTGEVIPEALIEKIQNSSYFNQGFVTTEFLAAGLLDMKFHTITEPLSGDISKFESDYLTELGLLEEIAPRYRSTYFQHIFNGGYSSGYYSYLWAEVLDADAFEAFEETGDVLNQAVALKFLQEVLEQGGSRDGNTLYENFRGKPANNEALMRNRGFIE